VLADGVVLLPGAIEVAAQNAVVGLCREDGMGECGFRTPRAGGSCSSGVPASASAQDGGGRLRLQMFCYGRHWNADTGKYTPGPPGVSAQCPPIPPELWAIVADAAAVASRACPSVPAVAPGACLVNHYTHTGRLGYHQDTSESAERLRAGSPVVSLSIGDAADFGFALGGHPDAAAPGSPKPQVVRLESGDVLVFGGPARLCFHSVLRVHRGERPAGLQMVPGRLNLTFREL
jgi:alkylated DNA repair dioxygenase AlkB